MCYNNSNHYFYKHVPSHYLVAFSAFGFAALSISQSSSVLVLPACSSTMSPTSCPFGPLITFLSLDTVPRSVYCASIFSGSIECGKSLHGSLSIVLFRTGPCMKLSSHGPPTMKVQTRVGDCSGASTSVEPDRIAKIRVETN